jgi:hypothetical protein
MDRQTDTPAGMHKCQKCTLSITNALQYMQGLHSEEEKSQRMKLRKLNIRNYCTECFLMPSNSNSSRCTQVVAHLGHISFSSLTFFLHLHTIIYTPSPHISQLAIKEFAVM